MLVGTRARSDSWQLLTVTRNSSVVWLLVLGGSVVLSVLRAVPCLKADDEVVRASRLALCAVTLRTLMLVSTCLASKRLPACSAQRC